MQTLRWFLKCHDSITFGMLADGFTERGSDFWFRLVFTWLRHIIFHHYNIEKNFEEEDLKSVASV